MVVAYPAEPQDDAVAEHVRIFVRGRRSWRLWLRHDEGSAAALAGAWRVHAADAQPHCDRDEGAGVLPVWADRGFPPRDRCALPPDTVSLQRVLKGG